jgi:hypothetical protein
VRIRVQLNFVIDVKGPLPEMTTDLCDAYAGAVKGLYPTLEKEINVGRVVVDIEPGGKAGFTHLKTRK